ncbi:MAG: hypothetical protein ACI9AF_000898, partial [Granulosicoccus sp.]
MVLAVAIFKSRFLSLLTACHTARALLHPVTRSDLSERQLLPDALHIFGMIDPMPKGASRRR